MPENVTSIGSKAFRNCEALKALALPENFYHIAAYAFENCSSLTDLYLKSGVYTDRFAKNWDYDANFYVHTNVDRYAPYLGLQAVHADVSDLYFALLPAGQEHTIAIYDTLTGEFLPFTNPYPATVTRSGMTLNGGVLLCDKGGYTFIRFEDQNNTVTRVNLCVIENHPSFTFSDGEKDYLALCLDMCFSLDQTIDSENIVDIDMSYMDQLLHNISSLGDYIAGLIDFDLTETTILKNTLADFIKEYVDNEYAHYRAVDDTKMILAGMNAVCELYEESETWLNFLPNEILDTMREIYDMRAIAKAEGLARSEFLKLSTDLARLNDIAVVSEKIRQSKSWMEAVKDTRQTFDYYREALGRFTKFSSDNSLFNQLVGKETRIKLFNDNLPGKLESGIMFMDSVIYIATDYTNNIEVLEMMRETLLATNQYSKKDIEIRVIDELIGEYHTKWIEGISDFANKILAETIVNIATKHPALTIVTVAVDVYVTLSSVDEKAEWLALSCYRDALDRCMHPLDDLYFNGEITSDTGKLKEIASLYLSILLKSNELAVDIAIHDERGEEFTEAVYALNYNISLLNDLIDLYFN